MDIITTPNEKDLVQLSLKHPDLSFYYDEVYTINSWEAKMKYELHQLIKLIKQGHFNCTTIENGRTFPIIVRWIEEDISNCELKPNPKWKKKPTY